MSAAQQSFLDLFCGKPSSPPMQAEDYLPARSRNTDPPSSHRAEESVKRNGTMRGQRILALQLVEQNPGCTSKQLAGLGTLDRYQLARRLSDLHKMKLVRTTQAGSEDLRWWPNG